MESDLIGYICKACGYIVKNAHRVELKEQNDEPRIYYLCDHCFKTVQ